MTHRESAWDLLLDPERAKSIVELAVVYKPRTEMNGFHVIFERRSALCKGPRRHELDHPLPFTRLLKKPPKSVEERIPKAVSPMTGGIGRHDPGSNCRHEHRPDPVEHVPPNPAADRATKGQAAPKMGPEVVLIILVPMESIHRANCCPGAIRTLV